VETWGGNERVDHEDMEGVMKRVRRVILDNVEKLATETVATAVALGRIAAGDLQAVHDTPSHDESLRDGYVIGLPPEGVTALELPIAAEIPAGIQKVARLDTGVACRIYTGGLIPAGAEQVIPFEVCREVEGRLCLDERALRLPRTYIKKRGSEVRTGELLVPRGVRLTPEHLWLLSSSGVLEAAVARQPVVACFCTGSELVSSDREIVRGQKVSINSLLLQKQLPLYGAIVQKNEIIPDEPERLLGVFAKIKEGHFDLVVTTGGMGPGKYDLVEDAFSASGGHVLLSSLPMQPGKSILVGKLGATVVISLPGPPHAVNTLVNELVGPVLLMLQGVETCWPQTIQAELTQDYYSKKDDIMQAKNGVLAIREGRCFVRMAGRLESGGCYVILPPGKHEFKAGETVDVHLSAQFCQDFTGYF